MDGRMAWIRVARRGAIEPVLDRADECRARGFVGLRHSLRRHDADAQLAHDLLPSLWRAADGLGIEGLERQSAGLETLVMAGDAILGPNGPAGPGSLRVPGTGAPS